LATENRYRIEAVDRALQLLTTLAEHPDSTITELTELTGNTKSLVFRMLKTLEERGFVVLGRRPGGYVLGYRMLTLGNAVAENDALLQVAREPMEALVRQCGESVYLAHRDGHEVMCLAEHESHQAVRLVIDSSRRAGLYVGGATRLLLAYAPDDVIEQVLGKHIDDFIPKSMRERKSALRALEKVRREGLCEAKGEIGTDAFSLSAPIFQRDGSVSTALCIVGPLVRYSESTAARLRKLVVTVSREISLKLGYAGTSRASIAR
jgi:DNA-binding IclR family transcriptional regulator